MAHVHGLSVSPQNLHTESFHMSVKEPQSAQVPGKENEAGLLGRAACLRKGKSLARVDATQPHGKLLEAGFPGSCSIFLHLH